MHGSQNVCKHGSIFGDLNASAQIGEDSNSKSPDKGLDKAIPAVFLFSLPYTARLYTICLT